MDANAWPLILLTATCFGVGFGVSWLRARKRIMQRYQEEVEKEMVRRVQQEVLRQVTEGPVLREKVEQMASGLADEADTPPRKVQ